MNDLINLDDNDFEGLQAMCNQITNQQLVLLNNKLKQFQDAQLKTEQKVDILQEEFLQTKEMMVSNMRVTDRVEKFINQNDFGSNFRVKIGSGTVGKLFKVVGIAKVSTRNTEPYQSLVASGYSVTDKYIDKITGEEHRCYKWNYKKCLEKIENWLTSHELLEQFYSICTEKEMLKFINNLYDLYILNKLS
jgi:glutathione peroxidase-family protein